MHSSASRLAPTS